MIENNADEEPEATKEQSRSIKAIGKDTVHKICSGQVVLSLAVAVKELVENSIDAGATLVEVKLREQGLEFVEVTDNGCGVEEKNLEGLTAKYHTSKLREFVDLQGVETFGFRGEALSSLCALSDMVIVTKHKSAAVGIRLDLDHEGIVKKRAPCARTVGTTVTMANLFSTLPVRKKDFTKNIKKEFTKMCQVLQAYCLVSKGVRIICSNTTSKGNKTIVMQTNGANDILANISAVFGNKQVNDILPIKSPFGEQKLTEDSLSDVLKNDAGESISLSKEDLEHLNEAQFQLEGFISNCSHGAGRSARDRQYYYVNSRPCDPKNIAKVVNEIYHRYNVQQYPFVFLNVITARSEVDVNLTPDKRQLLLHNEKILLIAIKKALLNTFGNVPNTFKLQNNTILGMLKSNISSNESDDAKDNIKSLEDIDEKNLPISTSQRFADVLSQWKHTGDTKGSFPTKPTSAKRKCNEESEIRSMKMQKIHEYINKEAAQGDSTEIIKNISYKSESDSNSDSETTEKKKSCNESISMDTSLMDMASLREKSKEFDDLIKKQSSSAIKDGGYLVETISCKTNPPVKEKHTLKLEMFKRNSVMPFKQSLIKDEDEDFENLVAVFPKIESTPQEDEETETKVITLDDSYVNDNESSFSTYTCSEIRTSLAEIEFNIRAEENFLKDKSNKTKLERLRFKSIINPNQNKNAEDELQREISKDSFAQMEILGQFNLGFIIVKLDDDLFIVDQHATDEKYNFEMLQKTTMLQYQKLAVPQLLEMTAVNEMILMDHLEVFEKNGFKFEIDQNAPPTKRIRLLGKPFSKNWEFGKDDIDELIFMLQDAPEGTVCRPSRIRSMFASRACRKSVMIGKALNKATMKMLVTHMGEIDQPWNCPHGRPTMRHLINTAMLVDADETK